LTAARNDRNAGDARLGGGATGSVATTTGFVFVFCGAAVLVATTTCCFVYILTSESREKIHSNTTQTHRQITKTRQLGNETAAERRHTVASKAEFLRENRCLLID
jgi:hypothetical protein